jgi:AcrR family transcriptional regulator
MSTPDKSARAAPPFADASCQHEPTCARDRLFSAATDLFYRFGFRAVSVDQIAAEAETTKVTFYRVFSSKDELIVEVLKQHTQYFADWWDAIVSQYEGDPRRQVEAIFDALMEKVCSGAKRGSPIANAATEITDDDHPAKQVIAEHSADISRRMRGLCEAMGASEPEQLGDSLTLLLQGVFAARVVFNNVTQVRAAGAAAKALLDCADYGTS